MIKRLKYSEIDFEKYTNCIENSVQKTFYAKKEILDFLSEKWELLVLNDYRAVMPIPMKKKLGINFVLMPLFCQQLGVFSHVDDVEINELFLSYFRKNYKTVYYSFNHLNHFESNLSERKNFVAEQKPYLQLRKGYFKGRKSTVKTAQYLNFFETKLDDESKQFFKLYFKGLDKSEDCQKFLNYITFLNANEKLKIFGCKKEDVVISMVFIIEENKRLHLLSLVNNEKFKNDNGPSFLIDRLLKDTISDFDFDFMGSSIRGIQVFFKSFGSDLKAFPVIENSKKTLIFSLLR